MLEKLYKNFSIIPLKGKAPFYDDWTKYQHKKIDFIEVENHFGNYGVVCGYDNLEVIDIDNPFGDADDLLQFIRDNHDLSKYFINRTQRKGYHIYYKCNAVQGNLKLARRLNKEGKPKTIIETRGKGGQVVFYDDIVQGSIDNIPVIDKQERDTLIEICKAQNEYVKKSQEKHSNFDENNNDLPGTKYNNDFSSIDKTINLLKNAGWVQVTNHYFRRPGKKTGVSATFGKVGKNKFYVFSSNAHPFESETSYSMFGVLCELKYNGDYSACAKDLYQQNKPYNDKKTEKKQDRQEKQKKEKPKNKKWRILEEIIDDWNLSFRYNEITKVLDYKQGTGDYQHINLLLGDIHREMEVNRGLNSMSQNKISEMLKNSTYCEIYNPIKIFFNNLPKWNGKNNIKKLCEYITLTADEDPDFFYEMLKKHLIRMIRCAKEKKYTNRIVLVLFGKQEIGKSEFFRWLATPDLYYEEIIDPGDKDSILALSKYMMINIDELDSLTKKDIAKLKSFISKGEITRRIPYARYDETFIRIASFVASTNKLSILTDAENTRWVILKVEAFDWRTYTKKLQPLQIWAEALYLYNQNNEAGDLTKSEKNKREQRNELEFLQTSQEREILIKYFKLSNTDGDLTMSDIKMMIEKKLYPTKVNEYKLVQELRRIHGEPFVRRMNNKVGKYYNLVPNFPNEYEMEQDEQNNDINNQKENLPF